MMSGDPERGDAIAQGNMIRLAFEEITTGFKEL